jgi:Domain of unknown function (DUF5666)
MTVKVGIVVIALAAVVLAACGGTASKSPGGSSSASPAAGRGNAVAGSVAQLTAGKMVVDEQTGNATVTYDSSTMVLQSGTGSLADAATGTCVNVTGQREASGAITAMTLQVMLNMNGQCNILQGGNQGNQSPRPFPSGSPGQGRNPNAGFARGKVTAVGGTTLTVQQGAGDDVTVIVPSTARITRLTTASASRLTVGLCVQATGQRDSSGVLKARVVTIVQPGPNGCPTGGGGFGGGRSPRPSGAPPANG